MYYSIVKNWRRGKSVAKGERIKNQEATSIIVLID